MRPCRYCKSPSWKNPCWYYLNLESELRRAGHEDVSHIYHWDPPCDCDDYDEWLQSRDRWFGFWMLAVLFTPVVILIFLII
jgi:hypothetical protein